MKIYSRNIDFFVFERNNYIFPTLLINEIIEKKLEDRTNSSLSEYPASPFEGISLPQNMEELSALADNIDKKNNSERI